MKLEQSKHSWTICSSDTKIPAEDVFLERLFS